MALTQNLGTKIFEKSAIDTKIPFSKKKSWLPKMLHFHVHNKVSLKAEHIDLSKPLFITLKVCINFRFSNLNLAQCWLWLLVIQHSLLRRKATLIFCLKDYVTILEIVKSFLLAPRLLVLNLSTLTSQIPRALVHTSAFSQISKFLQIFSYLNFNLMAIP